MNNNLNPTTVLRNAAVDGAPVSKAIHPTALPTQAQPYKSDIHEIAPNFWEDQGLVLLWAGMVLVLLATGWLAGLGSELV